MGYDPYEFALDIFYSMPGFVAIDSDGNIMFMREHFAAGMGINSEQAVGLPVSEVVRNTRLPAVLDQKKSEWGRRQRPQSGITGKFIGDSICNRLLIKSRKDPTKIVGAMEYIAVHEYQDEEALIDELDYLRKQNSMYRKHIAKLYQPDDIVDEILGNSAKATELKELIRRVADTSASVFISGETGTGKELVANAIHKLSRRRKEQFIKVNCAAIPKDLIESELFGYEAGAFTGAVRQGKLGIFELASGGTLLLDEIGELSLDLQAKLLRVLQEKAIKRIGGVKEIPVDVRIICSTNRDLKKMVAEETFRADLFYRINTMDIVVPPLRERLEDIPVLVDYFIRVFNRQNGLSVAGVQPHIYRLLSNQRWPGNVRELEHCIERACIMCGAGYLEERHFGHLLGCELPEETAEEPSDMLRPYRIRREQVEEESILQALEACRGNRMKTAEMLNISRATLFRKMKKYGML